MTFATRDRTREQRKNINLRTETTDIGWGSEGIDYVAVIHSDLIVVTVTMLGLWLDIEVKQLLIGVNAL